MVAVRNYRDAMNVLEEHDFQYQVTMKMFCSIGLILNVLLGLFCGLLLRDITCYTGYG